MFFFLYLFSFSLQKTIEPCLTIDMITTLTVTESSLETTTITKTETKLLVNKEEIKITLTENLLFIQPGTVINTEEKEETVSVWTKRHVLCKKTKETTYTIEEDAYTTTSFLSTKTVNALKTSYFTSHIYRGPTVTKTSTKLYFV